jgi:D-alanine-D-alanine ligase-like ATP-grasp enzyme
MKIKLCVLFGGRSVEHEVSIITAIQAINKIDKAKYEIIPDYNNFILQVRLDAKASFRIISLIKCIIKEKVAKNRC